LKFRYFTILLSQLLFELCDFSLGQIGRNDALEKIAETAEVYVDALEVGHCAFFKTEASAVCDGYIRCAGVVIFAEVNAQVVVGFVRMRGNLAGGVEEVDVHGVTMFGSFKKSFGA